MRYHYFCHLNLFNMKKPIFFKFLFCFIFVLAAYTISFAQVGKAGGDDAHIQLAQGKTTIAKDLSEMLVSIDGNSKVDRPMVRAKRKAKVRKL
jgi:hypothetical protein